MLSEQYLMKLESSFARRQGRRACQVVYADLPDSHKNVLSLYERDTHLIIFNIDLVHRVSEMEIVASLIHEGRHAYQWHVIQKSDFYLEPEELISRWRFEFESYYQPLTINNDINYLYQEIEIDAIAYTSIQIENIGYGKLIIPEEIKDLVSQRKNEINQNIN